MSHDRLRQVDRRRSVDRRRCWAAGYNRRYAVQPALRIRVLDLDDSSVILSSHCR